MVTAALAGTVLLLAMAGYLAWHTATIPFPGLFTEPTLVVNEAGEQSWPGYAAGLQSPDQLVALDGTPLEATTALVRELSRHQPGDEVRLTARRDDGTVRDVQVRLEALPAEALTSFFVLPYVLGLIYLGIGTWVFVARWREPAGRTFAAMCTVIALSLGLLFDTYTTHWFPRVWITAASLIGSVAMHLALVFPQRARFLDRVPALRYLGYVPGGIIAIANQFSILNLEVPTAYFRTWYVTFAFAGVGFLATLAMMIYRDRFSESPIVQSQARTILLGSLLSFGPIVVWLIVFRYTQAALPPTLLLPWLILFPISVAYAILRYRLFDVSTVVSQGIAYALLSALVVGAYFLGATLRANQPLVLGVFVLLLALLLNPARVRLQRAVGRIFLGDAADHRRATQRFGHRQAMQRFGGRLAETTGLPSVLQTLDELLEADWCLQFAALFLYDPQPARYVPHPIGNRPFPAVTFARKGPLAHQMLQRRESLYLYRERPLPPDLAVEGEALEALRSALLIPVSGHGWVTLGPKRNGLPFASDDLTTLESLGSQLAVALEKARLFGDLERRMTEVDVLRWIGQAVNFMMDVDDLLELIYAQTSRVLDTRNFYIALYNPEKTNLKYAFYVEEGERIYKDEEWPVEMGLSGQIVRTLRPIMTEDYTRECARRGVLPGGRPGRAWMGVPLTAGDQAIGVMTVSSFDPAVTYTGEQLSFFSAVADQAAAILDKARLYREMGERAQQLAALNEVGKAITSTLDLQAVLKLITSKAVELLQAEAGSLVLVDRDTGELVFEVTAGPSTADLVGTRLPPGTGIVGMVVQEGKPVTIEDANSDQRRYDGFDDRIEFVVRSITAVPMVSRGRVVGAIELLNRRDGVPFDEDDERLLTAFAANAAVSIENARLFTQTDQALAATVEELSNMQRIDRELNATLDYNRVMGLTMDWALRMTGADIGLVAVIADSEDGGRGLRFLANHGYPEESLTSDDGRLWPLEQGIIGRVVRTGRPELVEDARSDPDYLLLVPGMVAQLAVPIRREEQIIGVIALESSQQGSLNRQALHSISRLADHAAIAIENARLHHSLLETVHAYEKEMARLVYTFLTAAKAAQDIADIAALAERPEFAITDVGTQRWEVLVCLQRAAQEVRTVKQSVSRAIRSQALNRALGDLTDLLERIEQIPATEQDHVREIVALWQETLLAVAGEVGQVAITEPVTNPYVVGGPVVGRGFVGREDIVRRLEELWAGSEVPPSVVLFGHRRMGKTSILRNLPGHLGASVHLAYVNLQILGDAPGGAGEVLLALADGAARALREAGRVVREPDPDAFQAHAYRAFEQYLRAVREALREERLILAVDEFEQSEEWMTQGPLPRDFLKVLRGCIQMEPAIAFAFAGLHTLEEMTADYFEPFFASVIPVKVRFLSRGAVFQLLANPSEDFPLDYDPEALEQVLQLTAGQPYLVQLVGHRLVSRFNDLAFERGQKPEPRFTAEDVEAAVGDPEFYQMGRYYFTGVWGQARQNPPGQQAVLRALASHPEGRTGEELAADTGLAEEALGAAVAALEHHDVVVKEGDRWRYAVELMRRWVAREQK